jgi:hypothetical protein
LRAQRERAAAAGKKPAGPIPRMADGKPNLQGHFQADAGGANWGLEFHPEVFGLPPGRGVIVDPPDKKAAAAAWAEAERQSRKLPERGYDDPTAHCFVSAGVPARCIRRRRCRSCRRRARRDPL